MILVIGDSLSAAYGIESRLGWVALLGDRLSEGGHLHRVVNASITGDTTRGGVQRLPRALSVHRPAIVILELGGNDGLRGIPIEEMRANLQAMIDLSEAAGAQVVLVEVSIPPNYGQVYRERFAAAFRDLSREHALPLAFLSIEEVAEMPGMLQPDGIHPTAAAQPLILDRIWPALEAKL